MNALLVSHPCETLGVQLQASLPCLLLPLRLIPLIPTTIEKGQQPLALHHILASLVKGRWIDGKAQALILLLSACDMPTIFMLQTFCRQDGGIATTVPRPHQPFQNRTIPPASRKLTSVCADTLVNMSFSAAKKFPAECKAMRLDLDKKLTEEILNWKSNN